MISIHLYKSTSPSCRGRVNIECVRRAGGWSGGRGRWISLVNPESRVKGTSPRVHTFYSSGMPLGMDRNIVPIEGNIDHVERNGSMDDTRPKCFLYLHGHSFFLTDVNSAASVVNSHFETHLIRSMTRRMPKYDICKDSSNCPYFKHVAIFGHVVYKLWHFEHLKFLQNFYKSVRYLVESCAKSICSS